jgi:hypothetical protein
VSLINEALKKAETEKQERGQTVPAGRPIDSGTMLDVKPMPSSRPWGLYGLLAVLVLGGGGAAYWMWFVDTPQVVTAGAASTEQAEASLPSNQSAKSTIAAAPAKPASAPVQVVQNTAKPSAKTESPSQAPASVQAEPTPAPKEVTNGVPTELAMTTNPAAVSPVPVSPEPRPEKPTPPAAAVQPKAVARVTTEEPRIDPSQFKVSTIMATPNGARAVINGRVVGVGQEVDRATVIAIDARDVELEISGRRVKVGL